MTSCAGVVPDADIAIRAACNKKLFLEEACPVCFGELGRSVAICNEGHAMCVACNAAWSGGCPVCRDRTVEVVTLADDEHDLAFERDMRVAASMLPHERAVPADVPTDALATYGAASGEGVAAVLVSMRPAESALGSAVGPTARRAVCVLIDVSASMLGYIARIDLRPLFAECAQTGAVLLVATFGTCAQTVFGPAVVTGSDSPPALHAGGSTALHLGLDHVRTLLESMGHGVGEVRVVTDGEADCPNSALESMRAVAALADVFLIATGGYCFGKCSDLLDNDTSKFEFLAPEDVGAALRPTSGMRRISVPCSADSRMYRNGNVTAPVDSKHSFFASAEYSVAFTGEVDISSLAARRDAALDFEVRRFLLSATALAHAKRVSFDRSIGDLARARKLARAKKIVAASGSFPDILARIDARVASIETGREESNTIARMATCAARAYTQMP